MSNLEKSIYISNLFDFYKNLLTAKQQEIFVNYYFNDIGLTEISLNLGVSRQAVLDCIKKTEKLLENYEEKLKLYKIYNNQKSLIENFDKTKDFSKLNKILKLWED